MMPASTDEREKGPHLSFSRLNRYLHCPEQYRLYYVERLRPKYPAASLLFGQILHQALAFFFRENGDAVKLFVDTWQEAGQSELTYGTRESWEKLRESGEKLLAQWLRVQKDGLRLGFVLSRPVEHP